jgi:ABC-type multidrug transport system fused ATPase/permease subunit
MRRAGTVRLKQIILQQLYQRKGGLSLATFCLIGVAATDLLAPWPLKIVFDNILLDKPLSPTFFFLEDVIQSSAAISLTVIACSIILIALLGAGFSYIQLYTTAKIGYHLTHILRTELFSRLQRLSLSFHNQTRSGELLTKVSGDTTALKDLFADWSLTMVVHLLTVMGMVVVMMIMNWQLGLVALATLPTLFVVLFYINRKIRINVRKQRKEEGKIASTISEVLASISLVQAFGREGYEEDRFELKSAENSEVGIQTARLSAAVTKAVAVVSSVGVAGTVLFGSWQVIHGRMTPGDLLIFVAYVGNLYKPVRHLGKLSAKFARAIVSAQRIAEILEIEPQIRDHPNAIHAEQLKGDILFDNVLFGYRKDDKVLDCVSFHIESGQRVALVGASGVGKSTIVSLLLRLYEPQDGNIAIDGININRYQRESLRSEIGIVLQDAILFGASIRENLSYGKPDATPGEIEHAAQLAHAHDFIMALPDGYDTILGERGSTLSGGQRQRICLARAIIKRPSILILDEPTSAVDSVSASLISDTVARVQSGKTTLVISHQFSSMYQFDQILVLSNGKIVENGPHEQLLGRKGYYYELFQRQIA